MPRSKVTIPHSQRDEWELHRREIFRLFIVEESPVAEIVKYMKQEHGFDRKQKDYEYRLNKWRFRRRLEKEQLMFIHNSLLERKKHGRPSEVVVSGKRWSESMIRGRLDRQKGPWTPNDRLNIEVPPDFLARVQTPSPLMSDLPEWPKELPWLQFDQHSRRAFQSLSINPVTTARPLLKFQGSDVPLVQMMRSWGFSGSLEARNLNSPRTMRAILEVIVPQAHKGDHELTAEILHGGSRESIAIETLRLLIYLETNDMEDGFQDITGCDIDMSQPEYMMDFLRNLGFLTKLNMKWLRKSANPTARVFLGRLLAHSIIDENSFDVLGWLVPGHFDVNHLLSVDCCLDDHLDWLLGHGNRGMWYHHVELTMLQASSLAGNIHAVRLFLDLGADPYNKGCQPDLSAVECAASLQDHDRANIIVDLLFSKPIRTSSEFRSKHLELSLHLAIARNNTTLTLRLLSERQRLGHWTIDSQHFTTAAQFADCNMIRLLASNSSSDDNGSIVLPKFILYDALSMSSHDLETLGDKLNCLLNLGADSAAPVCRHGGQRQSIFNTVIWLSDGNGISGKHTSVSESEDWALDVIKLMRKHGCPPERPTSTSTRVLNPTALYASTVRNYSRLVEYLLDWDTDIKLFEVDIEPQLRACDACYFIKYPTDCINGHSLLFEALDNGNTEIAKILLRRHPDLEPRNGERKFVMEGGDNPEVVTMLLEAVSANMDMWKKFFKQAVSRRNTKMIKELFNLLISMDTQGSTDINAARVLQAALFIGDHDKVYEQIAVCGYDSRCLFEAVIYSRGSKDYHQIIEHILEDRQNTTNDEFEIFAVASAAIQQNMYLMSVLMRSFGRGPWIARFPPENDTHDEAIFLRDWDKGLGWPSVHILNYAARYDNCNAGAAVFKTLLECDIPVKGMCLDPYAGSSADTWKQLISMGVDPNLKEPLYRRVPLLHAVSRDMLAHVEVLCEAQVPLDKLYHESSKSETAVQVAVEWGSPEMLQLLLKYGADVKHPVGYHRGATCLQIASGVGNIGLVRFLLHKGAKVNEKRALLHGRTAIEAAAENGRLDVLKLLLLQDEDLFQTAAGRYQFTRAAKLAGNRHGVIAEILRQHISWDSSDQRLFDDCGQMIIRLDDMTQKPVNYETRNPDFLEALNYAAVEAGFGDIYEIEGIEQWIGERAVEESEGCPPSWFDCSSVAEGDISTQDAVPTSKSRETLERTRPAGESRTQVNESSGRRLPEQLILAHDGICEASTDPVELHMDQTKELPAKEGPLCLPNPETLGIIQAVSPQAIRYQTEGPMWLKMHDGDIDDMMQDLSDGLATQDSRWEQRANRTALQNVSQNPGMVLGEVLNGAPQINDMGDDAMDYNGAEDTVADCSHAQNFNWGIWDGESFALHSEQLGYW